MFRNDFMEQKNKMFYNDKSTMTVYFVLVGAKTDCKLSENNFIKSKQS